MNIVVYQDFGSSVNSLLLTEVNTEEEANLITEGESNWLEDHGFPCFCRWARADVFESISKRSEYVSANRLIRQFGINGVADHVLKAAKV